MTLRIKGATTIKGLTTVGFGPLAIPGLQLWLDASDANTITYSSGSLVSQIRDKSGNGYNATQATVGNQPTLTAAAQNGLSVLTFNGTSSSLSVASLPLPLTMSLFAAVQSTIAKPMFIEHSINSNSNDGFYFYGSSGNSWTFRRTNTVEAQGSSNWLGSSFAAADLISSAPLSGSTVNFSKDGSTQNNGTITGTSLSDSTVTQNLYIFSRAGTSTFTDGKLGELIIFNRTLSSSQISAIRAYLKAKWATP